MLIAHAQSEGHWRIAWLHNNVGMILLEVMIDELNKNRDK